MTALREAAQQALEALTNPWAAGPEGVADAITALRAALAQQTLNATEECEHKADGWYAVQRVAGVTRVWPMTEAQALRAALAQQAEPAHEPAYKVKVTGRWHDTEPLAAAFNLPDGEHLLYTTPPQRLPLTEEEIEHIGMTHQSLRQVVRAAEKASWEKNHGQA